MLFSQIVAVCKKHDSLIIVYTLKFQCTLHHCMLLEVQSVKAFMFDVFGKVVPQKILMFFLYGTYVDHWSIV